MDNFKRKNSYTRNRRKFFQLRKIMIFLIIIAIIGFILSQMKVKVIDVNGARKVDASEILQKSCININSSLIFINTSKVRKKIQSIPLIKNVYIDRNFPSKISIDVEERIPAFAVLTGNRYFLIDKEGYSVEMLNGKPSKRFLLIECPKRIKNIEIGKKLNFTNNESFIALINKLKSEEKKKIDKFIIDNEGINLQFLSGLNVFLGNDNKLEEKLKILHVLYYEAIKRKLYNAKIDIRYVENPYIVYETNN